MKKSGADRRAPLPCRSDYTKQFRKDWARYNRAGKVGMSRAIELMTLITLKAPLGPEWPDRQLRVPNGLARAQRISAEASCSSIPLKMISWSSSG